MQLLCIGGSSFSNAYTRTLHKMDDYRIEGNLKISDCINDVVAKTNAKISAAVAPTAMRSCSRQYPV